MDPDTALANARDALARLDALSERNPSFAELQLEALQEVADSFRALDGWLSEGGYRPKNWQR